MQTRVLICADIFKNGNHIHPGIHRTIGIHIPHQHLAISRNPTGHPSCVFLAAALAHHSSAVAMVKTKASKESHLNYNSNTYCGGLFVQVSECIRYKMV